MQELGNFIDGVNKHLHPLLRTYRAGVDVRNPRGELENVFLTMEESEPDIRSEFYNQVVPDGNYTIVLAHQVGELPIGAFMSMDDIDTVAEVGRYRKKLKDFGIIIPDKSLWIVQIQGPTSAYTEYDPSNRRSYLINPNEKSTSPRINWESFFLDMSVEIARELKHKRVYILPGQENQFITSEKKLKEIEEKSPADAQGYRERNERILARYNGTPRRLGWEQLEEIGPRYKDVA